MPTAVSRPDQSISLQEAADWIADTTGIPRPHASTMHRWTTKGVRGVRLKSVRVGAKHWTTPGDIAVFLDALNSARSVEPAPESPSAAFQHGLRLRQVEAACAQLDGLCAGFDGFANETKNDQTVRTVPVGETSFRPTGAIGGPVCGTLVE